MAHESSSMPTPPVPLEALICKDFQRGNCTHASCKYIHVERGEPTKAKLLQLVLQGKGYVTHCTDFLAGKCHRADCRYVHLNQQEVLVVERYAQEKAQQHQLAVSSYRKKQPCRDFAAGRCRRGDGCRYSHSTIPHEPGSGSSGTRSSHSSSSSASRTSTGLPGTAVARPPSAPSESLARLHHLLEAANEAFALSREDHE